MIDWQPSGQEPGKDHSDIPRDKAGGIAKTSRDAPATDVIILTASDKLPGRP